MAQIYNTDSKGRKYVCEYGICDYIDEASKYDREGKYELNQSQIREKFKNLVIVKDGVVQNKTGGSFDE